MDRYAIGVDIGGTNTKIALVDQQGRICRRAVHPTPQSSDPEWITGKIIALSQDFRQKVQSDGFPVEGIGFTVPHLFEGRDWIQRQTNNMPGLEGFPMYPPLQAAFGPSIAMSNDLNAAGMAEHMFGKGRSYDRMLLMAIGTGIATAFITEDGLVGYNWGTNGDTGQIIVDPDGLADCSCGGRGCLEAVAAAPAIRLRALREVQRGKETLLADRFRQKNDLEAKDVSEAALAGDQVAKDILDRAGHYLGVALTSYLHIFRPSLIVLGGGVAQAGDLLIQPIRSTMNRLASPWYLARLQAIEISALGANGGAIGCACLILYPGKYVR